MSNEAVVDKARHRKALLAWGSLAAAAALITTAAFTDAAHLNLGTNGIGGADSTYNIQVGATDAEGAFIAGQWQEADDPAGVPIAIEGAQAVFPGSDPISVVIPVRNDSPVFNSSLTLTLSQLPDDAANGVVTDANYLSSLRFDVSMPATSLGATPVAQTDLTFAEVSALVLNDLAADEESTVTIAIRLLSQTESGAAFPDNDLSGKGAFLQATFDGESV